MKSQDIQYAVQLNSRAAGMTAVVTILPTKDAADAAAATITLASAEHEQHVSIEVVAIDLNDCPKINWCAYGWLNWGSLAEFEEDVDVLRDEYPDEELGTLAALAVDPRAPCAEYPGESTHPTCVHTLADGYVCITASGYSTSKSGNDFTGSASDWRNW